MKTILQVDDDANDVFLLQHAMKKVGMTNAIQVVNDGQQAIDYLQGAGKYADREKFPWPCLVLMDLKLPYVMGLDVLRWLRSQTMPPLTVVMLTASAEDADIAEAYRLGANAFLTKPSEARILEDMVRAINAFWLTHNTLATQAAPQSGFHEDFSLVGSRRARLPGKDAATAKGARDGDRNGNTFFRPLSVDPLLDPLRYRGFQNEATVRPPLTKRHTEVLQMIANGYSSRRIALVLSVSIKTVEKHRQAVMDRLDIHEIATLTRYAVSSGLVESKPYAQLKGHARWQSEKPLRRSPAHRIERACFQAE